MTPARKAWLAGAGLALLVAAAVGTISLPDALGGPGDTGGAVAQTAVSVVLLGAFCGLVGGAIVYWFAATPTGRDRSERLLHVTTSALPPRSAEWGSAMRAELAAIDDAKERSQFARSTAAAAFTRGLGLRLWLASSAGLLAAGLALAASRSHLETGRPGVMGVTLLGPAVVLALVSLASAWATRSLRFGLGVGVMSVLASLASVALVLAFEGVVWMNRHGIFILDADPANGAVNSFDVALDFFAWGFWLVHVVFWLTCVLTGALVGGWLGSRARANTPAVAPAA